MGRFTSRLRALGFDSVCSHDTADSGLLRKACGKIYWKGRHYAQMMAVLFGKVPDALESKYVVQS